MDHAATILTIGQEKQRRQLQRWAQKDPLSPLAIITGPAGGGKTTLVRRALGRGRNGQAVLYFETAGRKVRELMSEVDRSLARVQRPSATVIIDDIETLGGDEEEYDKIAYAVSLPRWRSDYERRSSPGVVQWVLVGRQLPAELGRRLRSRMREQPLMLRVDGLSTGELAELLQTRFEHPLAKHELALWTAVITTQLQSNPTAAMKLVAAISRGENPYAAMKELRPDATLTLTVDTQGLHLTPTVQLPSVSVDGGKGFVTFSPQLYLPKVAETYREQVDAFEKLIRQPRVKEHQIQRFLEEHPHFLKGVDYRKLVPHPVLERTGKNKLIPDFFLQPYDGDLVDILDLKLPNKTLFTGTEDRLKLSEAVATALAQVREYKDYFENQENKTRILQRYGVTAYRPKVSVVIGLDERVLPEEKRRQIMDAALPAGANIITYRQLAEKMKRYAELIGG